MADLKTELRTHRHGITLGIIGAVAIGVGVFLHARHAAQSGSSYGAAPAQGFIGTPYTQPSSGPGSAVGMSGTGGGGGGASPPSTATSTTSPTAPASTGDSPSSPNSPSSPSSPGFPPASGQPTPAPFDPVLEAAAGGAAPGPTESPPQGSAGGFAGSLVNGGPVGDPFFGFGPIIPRTDQGVGQGLGAGVGGGMAFRPTWANVSHVINGTTYYGVPNATAEQTAKSEGYSFVKGSTLGSGFTAGATYAYKK